MDKQSVTCPVCGRRMRSITAQHIRKHGFQTTQEFKDRFGIQFLRCQEMRERHSRLMTENSPNRGKRHSPESIRKMKRNRKGKGVGVCGKYERTPEIRAKISAGVTLAIEEGRLEGYPKSAHGDWVNSEKAGEVWVRSSWEERVVLALDKHDGVTDVKVEPFSLPYEFEGATRRYTPDFLVTFVGGLQELWEVKPEEFREEPRNQLKEKALHKFAEANGMNSRVVTLADIEAIERQTGILPWEGPGRPWRPEDGPHYPPKP